MLDFYMDISINGRIEKSLKLATACGAISTQSAGGTTGQATLDEALKYVD